MEAVQEKKTETKKFMLTEGNFGLAEYRRNDWVAEIDPQFSVNDVLEPSFWSHVAAQMQPLDTIEARWEDGSKIVHLRVKFCERAYAAVKKISVEDLGDSLTEIPSSSLLHRIDWKGPQKRFCVIRNSDNMIVHEGCKERTQAAAWMQDHERG